MNSSLCWLVLSVLHGMEMPPLYSPTTDNNNYEWIDMPDGPQLIRRANSISSDTSPSPLIPLTVTTNKSYTHNNKTLLMTRCDFKCMNDIDTELAKLEQRLKELHQKKDVIMVQCAQQIEASLPPPDKTPRALVEYAEKIPLGMSLCQDNLNYVSFMHHPFFD